jgi:hypothetical protein
MAGFAPDPVGGRVRELLADDNQAALEPLRRYSCGLRAERQSLCQRANEQAAHARATRQQSLAVNERADQALLRAPGAAPSAGNHRARDCGASGLGSVLWGSGDPGPAASPV